MDLNYVFLRQQVERSMAKAARNDAARSAHEELARAYEQAIERKSGGRIVFAWHQDLGTADAGTEQLINARPIPSASS
jgi:hypothetical protein